MRKKLEQQTWKIILKEGVVSCTSWGPLQAIAHGIYPNGADLTVKRSSGRSFEKMTLILKRIKKK